MRIALAQILSTADPAQNLDLVRRYATEARDQGAQVVVFPEATMCAFGHSLRGIAEPTTGEWAEGVRRVADELGLVVVAGMFTPAGDRVRNTLLIVGPGVDTAYDKIHLYDAFGFAESDTVAAGESPVVFDHDGTRFGVATCYDVRFPALFVANARAGAQVSLVPASWAGGPGKAEQWELLARARAIDSTTFVVAVDQADPAAEGREPAGNAPLGVGHSLVADPFGRVVAALGAGIELRVVDVDVDLVAEARRSLPVLENARDITAPARP